MLIQFEGNIIGLFSTYIFIEYPTSSDKRIIRCLNIPSDPLYSIWYKEKMTVLCLCSFSFMFIIIFLSYPSATRNNKKYISGKRQMILMTGSYMWWWQYMVLATNWGGDGCTKLLWVGSNSCSSVYKHWDHSNTTLSSLCFPVFLNVCEVHDLFFMFLICYAFEIFLLRYEAGYKVGWRLSF